MFPRPVPTFVGRRAELDRVLGRIDSERCFFVYGVGGIGKSEFVLRLIDELRARPRWSAARPVHLELHPGAEPSRALAELLGLLGSRRRIRGSDRQLSLIAELLDARPHLLFIDDAHHLPAQGVGDALGYLSRRVQSSRIFVASRRELTLSRDALPPTVTTLGPLDDLAAAEMIRALHDHVSSEPRDVGMVLARAHGSPFYIRRSVFRADERGDSISVDDLSEEAGRVLTMLAVARFRPRVAALSSPPVRELAERFLVDAQGDRVVLHDLVRDVVLSRVTPEQITAAHSDAAQLCMSAMGEPSAPLSAVDAVAHLLVAGRGEAAFEVVERSLSILRAAGVEHLLLHSLKRLRDVLPTHRARLDLLVAQSLARASLFDEAAQTLAQISDDGGDDTLQCQRASLLGEVALHRGDMAAATGAFERAIALAPDASPRFHARLRLASVATLTVGGERCRAVLADALAEVVTPSPRQRARHDLVLTASFVFDEQFERAAEVSQRAREGLPPSFDDFASRLAMLETLSAIESEDLDHARIAARHIDLAGVRQKVAALYRAILAHGEGHAAAVADELEQLHGFLFQHGDAIHGYLAGHHGASALAEIGRLAEAQVLAERTAQLSEAASLHAPAARARATQALLSAEGMQTTLAHELAERALASPHAGPRSRARAHSAHSRAYVIGGEVGRALEHLEEALAAVADMPGPSAAVWVERAAAELVGGSLDRAVEAAERAVEYYRGRSRTFETAHALLVLAAAWISRGRRSDEVLAERTLEHARSLSDRGSFRGIQVGCAILSAALARRRAGGGDPATLLSRTLLELDPERGSIYSGTLVAAIDGGIVARAVPGVSALLAHLGFADAVAAYLVDREGRRAASASVVTRERTARELFVDTERTVVVGRRGEVEITGRPLVCAILSALVQARGAPLSPELLYTRAWGVSDYHPLRHRSALYVGINRLRACLREVFPDREMVERSDAGWRLADDVDACVAIPVRG